MRDFFGHSVECSQATARLFTGIGPNIYINRVNDWASILTSVQEAEGLYALLLPARYSKGAIPSTVTMTMAGATPCCRKLMSTNRFLSSDLLQQTF